MLPSKITSSYPTIGAELLVPTNDSKCEDRNSTFRWNDRDRSCGWLQSISRYDTSRAFYYVLCANNGLAGTVCMRTCKKCSDIFDKGQPERPPKRP